MKEKHGLYIAVGVLCFIILIILIYCCTRRPRKRRKSRRKSSPLNETSHSSYGSLLEFEEAVIRFSDIEHGKMLGEGYFGVVSKGKWRGTDVAVKRLKEHFAMEDDAYAYETFKSEVCMYSNIRHHNIVQFMGVCLLSPNFCIVLEYMEKGSVADIIHKQRQVLSWGTRLKWAIDAAKGIAYLHTHEPSIIHRDLKSHNLLVDENDLVKVGDFGTTKLLGSVRPKKKKMRKFFKTKNVQVPIGDTSWAGTLRWAAPEVIPDNADQKINYTTAADIYSFGVTIWEMISNKFPFMEYEMDYEVMDAIQQGHRPDIPVFCPKLVTELIEHCWEGNPGNRPSIEVVLQSLIYLQDHVFGAETSINIAGPSKTYPPLSTPNERGVFGSR